VRWFKWIPHKEVANYIYASDFLIVPRHKEPKIIRRYHSHEDIQKVTEAFLLGKPVIASGISSSPYYMLVDPEELPEYVKKIVSGKINPPAPPKLTWQKECVKTIKKILKEVED